MCSRVVNRGQQSTELRVSQSVTSVPWASVGHKSSLQGGVLFLMQWLTGGGRASLSVARSNSWGMKREVQKLSQIMG